MKVWHRGVTTVAVPIGRHLDWKGFPMQGLLVYGIFGLIVVFIAVSTAIAHRVEKKRTEEWVALAKQPGMQFLGAPLDLVSRISRLEIFRSGRRHQFWNVIAVDVGETRVVVGDYRYTTGSGKHARTHVGTLCSLESTHLRAPHCWMRPEGKWFDSWFGGQDIDFPTDPDFSSSYLLKGTDEDAIRQLFQPAIRAWFSERKGEGLVFEAQGNWLVFHKGRRCAPADAPQLMDQALQILKCLESSAGETASS